MQLVLCHAISQQYVMKSVYEKVAVATVLEAYSTQ